ncbi:MAG: type II toxin-antitoxin system VapC family toxin [Mycobacteriales bacterium]
MLVDTSVWIDYFHTPGHSLRALLIRQQVLVHPWIVGELALGNLRHRQKVLSLLAALPCTTTATDDEVLALINSAPLFGLGVGYVDAALLASCRLTPGTVLWTTDKRLSSAAATLGLDYAPS